MTIEQYIIKPHQRLKFIRDSLDLNKKQFSSILKVKYRTYCQWEKKDSIISPVARSELIRLGFNPEYIYGSENILLSSISIQTIINKLKGSFDEI